MLIPGNITHRQSRELLFVECRQDNYVFVECHETRRSIKEIQSLIILKEFLKLYGLLWNIEKEQLNNYLQKYLSFQSKA